MDNLLRYSLRSCLLVGIYTRTENNCKQRFLRHLSYYYPCLIMLVIILGAIHAVLKRNFEEGYLLSSLVSTIVFVGQITAHCMVLLEALIKRQQHTYFHQRLTDIEALLWLRLRQRTLLTARVRRLQHKYSAFCLLSLVGVAVFANFASYYYWYGLFSILTMRLRIFQLSLYVDYLQLLLTALNLKLQQLVERKCRPRGRQLLDIDYKQLESIACLQAIKRIYGLIYEAFCLLNEMCGWSLFAIIACYFLDITLHAYWTLIALEGLLPKSTYISSTAALVPLAVIVIEFSLSCNGCKNGGVLFNRLINRLINTGASCQLIYKTLLYELSLQVQHQPLVVTARQIFAIDIGLLMAICVAIATYLIVLIQFLKSENSWSVRL